MASAAPPGPTVKWLKFLVEIITTAQVYEPLLTQLPHHKHNKNLIASHREN
jgi:hypothetical protein